MKILSVLAVAAMPLLATPVLAKKLATPKELKATAECVVEQSRKDVTALLRTLPGSYAEDEATRKLAKIYFACSGETMDLAISRAPANLDNGRAELAAAAAGAEIRSRGFDAGRASGAAAWYMNAIAGRAPGRGYDAKALGFQEFGSCIARAAPQASADLVQSPIGSAEERKAIGAIRPVVGGCVTQGQTMQIKSDQLRLLVAEPIYHVIVDGPAAGRRS